MVEVTLAVPFSYEGNEVTKKMLKDFKDIVNFCIEKAIENNVTSYARIRGTCLRGMEATLGLLDTFLPFSLQDRNVYAQIMEEEERS